MSDVVGRTADPAPEPGRPARLRGGRLARRRIVLWGGTLLCLGWLSHGWQMTGPGLATRMGDVKGADYIQFYIMGTRIEAGRSDLLYDMEHIAAHAKRRISPRLEYHPDRNPYGPQVALAFEPLAHLPFLTSLAVFSVVSMSAYAAAVWLLWRHAPGLARYGRYVALVAAAYPALLVTLRFGQISTLTLLAPALAVGALAAERRLLVGCCLGLLVYKPQLLVVTVPVLLIARDWRAMGGLVAASVAQLAIAWAGVGTDTMHRYLQTLRELTLHPDVVMLHPENSHSLRGALRLLGAPPILATAVGVTLIVACAPALARVWRGGQPPLARMSLLILVTLLLTPHLLTYDLLLLAVPIISLAESTTRHADAHARDTRWPIVLAVALYVAAYSTVIAQHAHLQLSTLGIAASAWVTWRTHAPDRVNQDRAVREGRANDDGRPHL